MSADKRKTILITFAGLAVVLVAVIFVVSPSFKSEDATGAIGAVQKHRAPQIAKADVILGGEQQRHQQNVLYADYLKDAATLQSLSRDITDAKARDAATLDGVRARIDAQKQDVEMRFVVEAEEALVDMKKVAESEDAVLGAKKLGVLADIDNVAAKVRVKNLENEDIQTIGAKIRDIAVELGPTAVEMMKLENENLDAAKATLRQIEFADLEAKIRASADYAKALADEEAALVQARNNLAMSAENRARFENELESAGARIRATAASLEAHAVANMKARIQADSEAIEALGKMAENKGLDAIKQDLNTRLADARARGSADMQYQFEAMKSFVNHAENLNMRLSEAFTTQLSALAENKASIRESDTFTAQAHALLQKAQGLEARSR